MSGLMVPGLVVSQPSADAGLPREVTPLVDGPGVAGSADSGGRGTSSTASGSTRLATVLSLFALVSIAVVKTQLTAHLFHSSKYPTAYSLWSCVVTCVLLVPFLALSERSVPQLLVPCLGRSHFSRTWGTPTRPMVGVLSLIVVFTAFDLGFTNIALANISTALQQCIASTNPFWTLMIETAVHGQWQRWQIYAAVFGLVAGATLASVGSFDRISAWGVAAACLAVLSSASKYVFTHRAFHAFKGELGALALLFWVDLLMAPIYLVWTLGNGELVQMFRVAFASTRVTLAFTFTGALGGVRALTQYVVLMFVSATSMSTANIFTQVLNIAISIPLQRTPLTPYLGAGILLVIGSSAAYTLLKAHKPSQAMQSTGMECSHSSGYHRGDWSEKDAYTCDGRRTGVPRMAQQTPCSGTRAGERF